MGIIPIVKTKDKAMPCCADTTKTDSQAKATGCGEGDEISSKESKSVDKKLKIRPSSILILFVRFYRKFISPLKPACCRFHPTCSQYSLDALIRHGFFRGSLLTIWRILRCQPFSKGGYDPVPPRHSNDK